MYPSSTILRLCFFLLCIKTSLLCSSECDDIFRRVFAPPTPRYQREIPASSSIPEIKVPFYEETGIFGVTKGMAEKLTATIREHLGTDVLDVYAIGSRVSGRKSSAKSNASVSETSDLDIVIHLSEHNHENFSKRFSELVDKLKALFPFPVQVFTTSTTNDEKFTNSIIAYPLGEYSTFVLIPKNHPIEKRSEFSSILIKSFR